MSRELHEAAKTIDTTTCRRSLVADARDVERVRLLIELGARVQLLEALSNLPRERLVRIYKEVRGESPPKGMLPFSTDWFVTWQPNIHGSLFINLYRRAIKAAELDDADALILAYRLYREQVTQMGLETLLSITRAWRLIRFVDAGMLTTTACNDCGGQFVVHAFDLVTGYRCGLCAPPSRAGQGKEWKRIAAPGAVPSAGSAVHLLARTVPRAPICGI